MAKKLAKKKKSVSGVKRSTNIEFHSWTFFIFVLFVLLAVLVVVLQQKGINVLKLF